MPFKKSDIKKWLDTRSKWGRDLMLKGFRDKAVSTLGDDTH